MIDALMQEIARHGDRAALIPVEHLPEIRQDLEALKGSVELNGFQRFILSDLYSLDVPQTGFQARSVLVVASPVPALVDLRFTRGGRRLCTLLPGQYAGKGPVPARVEAYLKALLEPAGFHAQYAPRLPFKRIAARSGLAAYGRNNITYVEGLGSFHVLALFFTDLECAADPWREARQMELCRTCQLCLNNCPTGAILPDRFLIDNERCLTFFNEAGGGDVDADENDGGAGDGSGFPAWIDPAAHHCLYGCLRCQTICPLNRARLSDRARLDARPGVVDFSEEETALLWEGRPFDQFPAALREKVQALDMMAYLGVLPRNLRALFRLLG